jgi:hypothetical protein
MRGINKARRLLAINCLCQIDMEKSILHIYLMHRPVMRESNRKNHMNGSWLDDRVESFPIVHSMLLSKTTEYPSSFVAIKSTIRKKFVPEHSMLLSKTVEYPSSFVAIKSTIRKKFVLKHPLASNHISVGWPRDKGPGVVGLQGCELLKHCVAPIRISKGATIRLGQGRQSNYMKVEALLGLAKAMLASCDHAVVILDRRNV